MSSASQRVVDDLAYVAFEDPAVFLDELAHALLIEIEALEKARCRGWQIVLRTKEGGPLPSDPRIAVSALVRSQGLRRSQVRGPCNPKD